MSDVSADRMMRGVDIGDEEWMRYDNSVARVMHFHNVILHATNSALLFLLLAIVARRKVSDLWLVGLALIWALHPLRVEVVCWVSERKELLSCFWMLLSLLIYFNDAAKGRIWYVCSLVCAALAMAAKPVAVTLPAVIFAWDMIFAGGVKWRRLIPFAILSAATCLLTMQAQAGARDLAAEVSLVSRLTSIFGGPIIYIRQTFWPFQLSIMYAETAELNMWLMAAGVILIVAMATIVVLWIAGRGRITGALVFGISWVYVGLMPMLGIVKVGNQEHSDRYTYWVGCGVCVTLALLIVRCMPMIKGVVRRMVVGIGQGEGFESEWIKLRKMTLCALAVSIISMTAIANQRMGCWKDTLSLFRDAFPKCWRPDMAMVLARQLCHMGAKGRDEAEAYLRESVTHYECELSRLNLAEFLLTKKEDACIAEFGGKIYVEAELLIESVIRFNPENARARELKKRLLRLRGKE